MKQKIQTEYGHVEYTDTPELRDAVFERVMRYFKEQDAWAGEVIHQNEDCIIESPSVLSDIADDILQFKVISDD